jgi:regulator of protease activity HflC (stomatin/prohibitin superfamily)
MKATAGRIGIILVCGAVIYGMVYQGIWKWMICRQYCQPGQSLQVTSVLGEPASKDSFAEENQKGVREQMKGPGRHFLSPLQYSNKKVQDVVVEPGEIGLVVNRLGKNLPLGRFIAGPDEKGTQKHVLTPGVWRINDHGQKVEIKPATIIPPGYVGVKTLREGANKGILKETLQPGYYNNNEREILIKMVEIGYQVWQVSTEYEWTQIRDKAGNMLRVKEFKDNTGVSFPLADGKEMHLDFTVVWGIFPENAARITKEYGTVEMVESKVIEPQVLSICKNLGSNLTTKEFIEGATREEFQERVTTALKEMGTKKGLHILIALVRGFHPAEDIKATIQARMLAEEEKETLRIEQQTDTVAAKLRHAEKMVDVAIKDFDGETQALIAREREEGEKKAAETRARADRTVAGLVKLEKELQAEAKKIAGRADADVTEAKKNAEATQLKLLIAAFGGADAFNMSTFADNLSEDLRIRYLTHGDGTLWTSPGMEINELGSAKVLEKADQWTK